jgi:hypothetical protein
MFSSLHAVSPSAGVASTETGALKLIALTSSPEIAACVRRRSFRGSAPWPPEATTRCQGTRRQHRPDPVRTGPEHPQPDGASASRPAEWCILRRRQRPSSCPTRQQSAAGNGCKSRPLSPAIDTLRPIAIIHHGGSSCPLALARLSCADVCLRRVNYNGGRNEHVCSRQRCEGCCATSVDAMGSGAAAVAGTRGTGKRSALRLPTQLLDAPVSNNSRKR